MTILSISCILDRAPKRITVKWSDQYRPGADWLHSLNLTHSLVPRRYHYPLPNQSYVDRFCVTSLLWLQVKFPGDSTEFYQHKCLTVKHEWIRSKRHGKWRRKWLTAEIPRTSNTVLPLSMVAPFSWTRAEVNVSTLSHRQYESNS